MSSEKRFRKLHEKYGIEKELVIAKATNLLAYIDAVDRYIISTNGDMWYLKEQVKESRKIVDNMMKCKNMEKMFSKKVLETWGKGKVLDESYDEYE